MNLDQAYQRLVQALDLTAQQQTQVKQLFDTHKQAVQNWGNQHGEEIKALREQMAEAAKNRDRDKMTALREKMQQLTKDRPSPRKLNEQILGVLTDEQKEKFKKMRLFQGPRGRAPGRRARAILLTLGLSDQQKQQVEKIFQTADADAKKIEDPRGKAAIQAKAVESVLNTVLTAEQKEKFQKAQAGGPQGGRGRGPLSMIDLSDDQKAQVEKIMAAAREKMQGAEREQRRTIWRETMEKIRNEVLTEAQREELKKKMAERGQRGGDRGGQRRRRNRQQDRPKSSE